MCVISMEETGECVSAESKQEDYPIEGDGQKAEPGKADECQNSRGDICYIIDAAIKGIIQSCAIDDVASTLDHRHAVESLCDTLADIVVDV